MLSPAASDEKVSNQLLRPPHRFRDAPSHKLFHHTFGVYSNVYFASTGMGGAMRANASVLFTSSAMTTRACVNRTAMIVGV